MFSVEAVAPGLVDPGSVFGFLQRNRARVFPRGEFDDMFADPMLGGRVSIPGPVVISALVLESLFNVSDREVVERLKYDLRWKAACGVGVDEEGFHPTVLTYWRNRIAMSKDPGRIKRLVDRIVVECGVLKGAKRRVADSTVVDDAVARQDTITLLVWQIAKIADLIPGLRDKIMGLPGGVWYQNRSKPEIDWGNRVAKDEVVSILVEDANTVQHWLNDGVADFAPGEVFRVEVDDQAGLLAVLAGQDVEPAPGSDGTDGRWRIARGTAYDRVISTVDTQTRHVRKTGQNKHDGFKAHVVVEPDTGLITDTAVSSACGPESSDARNAARMLARDPNVVSGVVTEVLGDSAYDSTEFLVAADGLEIEPVVKPRPVPVAVPNGYSLDDFIVDVESNTVTCPGGHMVTRTEKGRASFTSWCGRCPLKSQCTKAKKGRIVTISDSQLRLRKHREQARAPGFTERLRAHRPMVERSLAWMLQPGRQTPYRGITKTSAWWSLRASAVNLKRLLGLGLEHDQDQGWILNPIG
jgi:hypothetical protein